MLVYTEETSFDAYDGFPIRVNPQLMNAVGISTEDFFADHGEYEIAFLSYLQTHRTPEDFHWAFAIQSDLIIDQWSNDFIS